MKKYISYSNMLMRFIEPILDGEETEDEYLAKAKIGLIAWNYQISDQNNLPYDKEMKEILRLLTKENAEGAKILNALVLRKEAEFSNFNQFILNVRLNRKADHSTTLYVESFPVDILKSLR